jgi:hypothetical protein
MRKSEKTAFVLVFCHELSVIFLGDGQNDLYKRQFFSFGSTIPILEIKIICQTKTSLIGIFFPVKLTGVTSWLLHYKLICSDNFSNFDCKVSYLKKQVAGKSSSHCKCFFIFKICQTVTRHKYNKSISQFIFCQDLTNYLISKLRLPYTGVVSTIVYIAENSNYDSIIPFNQIFH